MLGFTPFKKHANKFNYIPGITIPRRRRASSVVPSCAASARRMPPGSSSRAVYPHAARSACGTSCRQGRLGPYRVLKLAGGVVLILLFVYLLYPKLAEVFIRPRRVLPCRRRLRRASSIHMLRSGSCRTITRRAITRRNRWLTRSCCCPRWSPTRLPREKW